MIRSVVDTNVAIIANGRPDPDDQRPPSIQCRIATVTFLSQLLKNGKILLDVEGAIQAEYRNHLNPAGAPGVGDRFYLEVLHSAPNLVERVDLPKRHDGEYEDLPQALIDVGFDPSDRKFAALACKEGVAVHNATDSDWIEHSITLETTGVQVENLCGCEVNLWFAA